MQLIGLARVGAEDRVLAPDGRLALWDVTAGFAIEAWNDLTEPATAAIRASLAAAPEPPGLHVFVANFAEKATNLVANAEQNRVRLIQPVLVA